MQELARRHGSIVLAAFALSCSGTTTDTARASHGGGSSEDASIGGSPDSGGGTGGTGGRSPSTGGVTSSTGGANTGGANSQCPWADLETDPGSCGTCFNECIRIASPGDYPGKVMKVSRDGGNATTLALVESDGSSAIALDDENVYWAEGDGAYGPLYSVPTSGGAIHRLSAWGGTPVRIVADTTYVYWSAEGGNLSKIPLAGGAQIVLWTEDGSYPISAAGPFVVDGKNVYFQTSDNTVRKMPLDGDGGNVTILATVDQTLPFPTALSGQDFISDVAIDTTSLYYAVRSDATFKVVGRIAKVPLAGGASVTLAGGPPSAGADAGFTAVASPVALAVAGGFVYWIGSDGTDASAPGQLNKVPVAGGPVTAVAQGFRAPGAMAIDDMNAYLAIDSASAVVKVSLSDGTITKLATAIHPAAIAVRSGFVYYTTDNGGSLANATSSGACNAGVCAPCPGAMTVCFGTCAQIDTDIANCGACGVVCAPDESCKAGACQ